MARFKKGQSGNPGGRKKLPEEVKAAKNLTNNQMILILNRLMFMTKFQLQELLSNPATTLCERIVGRILEKADLHGDSVRLDFLLNRTIGKVTEKIKHELPRPVIIKRRKGGQVELTSELPKEDEDDSE